MKLVVDPFDSSSVDNAIAQIEKYVNLLDLKQESIVDDLARLGAETALSTYASGAGSYDTVNPDFNVNYTNNGKTATVIASGEDVGFMEFGTGIAHPEWEGGSGIDYTPPEHGTYGKKQGANPGYWHYDSRVVNGNDPIPGMLNARNEMISAVHDIAREVFGR